jgi:hypothetical protein
MLLDGRLDGGHTNASAPRRDLGKHCKKTGIGILTDEPRLARAAGDVSSVSPWVAISPDTTSNEWPRVDRWRHKFDAEVRLYRMRNHTSIRMTRKEAGCRYHLVFRRDVHLMAIHPGVWC